ncbi:Spermatogenesis-associated protein 1 [Merluccius polli]|uniref:Spermatogenesis-associated protein 1 n=1 Tax=Merluccius polli TaxID=89951 RepID=A0AA47P1C2_MERPO|nr:Spermatogenesis-associated protein 1 [Merluccius polli]
MCRIESMMMELPCESVRYLEERRPKSSKLVELHVLYVPDDQWDRKLNKVPAEAIESFISAGFIRVYPDMTLETLRGELGISLGADIRADRLSFLKCVGRSLAVVSVIVLLRRVKHEQERDLKVKTFAPPYAAQPELYLLPVGENNSSVCSQSLTLDTRSSSPDHQAYCPHKPCRGPATGTPKGPPVKFPLIPQGSRHSPPTPSAADEEEQRGEEDEEEEGDEEEEEVVGEVEEEDSCCSTEGENDGEGGSSLKADWTEERSQKRRCKTLMRSSHDTQSQDVDPAQTKGLPGREETTGWKKDKLTSRPARAARDSGLPETLEDRQSGFFSDRLRPSKDVQTKTLAGKKPKQMVPGSRGLSSRPMIQYGSQPPASNGTLATNATAGSPLFQNNSKTVSRLTSWINNDCQFKGLLFYHQGPSNTIDVVDMGCISLSEGDELIEEIKLVREERKQLEWTRQELLRKGKDLLAQNRNRRNQARDSWKKKYFETKKAAAPLEETLRNLRQELETFYNKLLHQLQARDGRGRARHHGRSSTKNEFIIQIMTESHEIDNLRRQVEDAKMKLITEIRLRKQAATELRALKAELAQKKSQSSHTGPMTSQPFGPIPWNRPFAQKTGS